MGSTFDSLTQSTIITDSFDFDSIGGLRMPQDQSIIRVRVNLIALLLSYFLLCFQSQTLKKDIDARIFTPCVLVPYIICFCFSVIHKIPIKNI